jgi:hypothetical protein
MGACVRVSRISYMSGRQTLSAAMASPTARVVFLITIVAQFIKGGTCDRSVGEAEGGVSSLPTLLYG